MLPPIQSFGNIDLTKFTSGAGSPAGAGNAIGGSLGADTSSPFLDTLKSAIGTADQLGSSAADQVTGVLTGNGADVHSAMIAVEKADLSFQMMMQVRNKIVQAYQKISKMPF